jgi:hypothetical protein
MSVPGAAEGILPTRHRRQIARGSHICQGSIASGRNPKETAADMLDDQ